MRGSSQEDRSLLLQGIKISVIFFWTQKLKGIVSFSFFRGHEVQTPGLGHTVNRETVLPASR